MDRTTAALVATMICEFVVHRSKARTYSTAPSPKPVSGASTKTTELTIGRAVYRARRKACCSDADREATGRTAPVARSRTCEVNVVPKRRSPSIARRGQSSVNRLEASSLSAARSG
jgi:hypothetical protein